jgi:putative tricarboxylic transport membrane protein
MALGFANVFTLTNFLILVGGCAVGIVIGALPGLNASTGVAILLPFTFGMQPLPAMLLLIGIYNGAMYGGSITAILINTPGTTASATTVLDGWPMARKGEAGKALGVATVASGIGGLMGAIGMILLSVPLAAFALKFGPAEYFAVGVFGLSIIGSLADKNVAKGLLAGVLGLLVSTVGTDPFIGVSRFTFNIMQIADGINVVPIMVGMFALSTVFLEIEAGGFNKALVAKDTSVKGVLLKWKEWASMVPTIIKSGIIGVIVGVMPGAGGTIANFVAYDQCKKTSRHPELYGTGYPEGVAASETANNATCGGAMVPLMTLGVPGSGTTAILLAAFMMQGLQPGPMLFQKQPALVYGIFAGFLIVQFAVIILGLGGARFWAKAVNIPKNLLLSLILVLTVAGAFSVRMDMTNVWLLFIFGIIGYFFKKLDIPAAPAVLGLVLGFLVESNMRRALLLSQGSVLTFLTRPISVVLLGMAVISVAGPYIMNWLKARKTGAAA